MKLKVNLNLGYQLEYVTKLKEEINHIRKKG